MAFESTDDWLNPCFQVGFILPDFTVSLTVFTPVRYFRHDMMTAVY